MTEHTHPTHTHKTQHENKTQRLTPGTNNTIKPQIPTQHKTTHVPQTHRHSLEASIQLTHKDTDHRTPPNHTHTTHTHARAPSAGLLQNCFNRGFDGQKQDPSPAALLRVSALLPAAGLSLPSGPLPPPLYHHLA